SRRAPAFLHLRCVRLWGHAGSDLDTEYRDPAELQRAEGQDPVLLTARRLLARGTLTAASLSQLLERLEQRVKAASADAVKRPKLKTRAEVVAAVAPSRPDL